MAGSSPASAQEAIECHEGALGPELQVGLSRTGDDQPELTVTGLDREIAVEIEARVTLGPLEHRWIAPAVVIPAGLSAPVPLAIPPEAFLHPLADTYVATLLVRVHSVDAEGRGEEVATPNLYVVWPDGQDRPPVVWSKADLAAHAPYGILDPDGTIGARIAAELPGVPVRLLPPIEAPPDALPATEGRERVTVSEDWNDVIDAIGEVTP